MGGGGGGGGAVGTLAETTPVFTMLEVTLNLCFKETIIIYTAVICFAVIYNIL